jgi:Methyltransferase domain
LAGAHGAAVPQPSGDVQLARTCPQCGGVGRFAFSATDENRRAAAERFRYDKCGVCGLIWLVNVPSALTAYYGDGYYRLPSREHLERVARRQSFQVALVRQYAQLGRLVEIGPAWGAFAFEAQRWGFDVTAIEMDGRCCEYLGKTAGIHAIHSDKPEEVLLSLPPSRVIVLWQVLEHLQHPWRCLESAIANLEVGGIIVFATPNPESFGFRLMRASWPHVDAPRHLWLFPIDPISFWLAERGAMREAVVTSDKDARHWNRFAWQRLLMNRVPAGPCEAAAYVAGTAMSALSTPLELARRKGSSYTAIFRKTQR